MQDHAGIHGLSSEREGVEITHHLGNGVGGDVADDIGFGHVTGNDARQVPRFIAAPVVDGDILCSFVARSVLKKYLGILFGDGYHRVHVAEGRGEDHIVALAGVVADDALGVGALGDHLAVSRLHVVEILFEGQQSLMMGVTPAEISYRPHVDKGNAKGFLGCGGGGLRFLTSGSQQQWE